MLQTLARRQIRVDISTKNVARVLIVQDDRKLAYLLRRVLSDEQYQVDLAHSAHQSLELVERGAHDIIIIDCLLPAHDGRDLCRHFRTCGVTTPILMLTTDDMVDQQDVCLHAGASNSILKPFSMHDFLTLSGSMAGEKKAVPAAPLKQRAGDLILDPSTGDVWYAGRPISLTHHEFILLTYFMRHPGRILTRRQIIDYVWSYEQENTTTMVDSCVRSLNEKIASAPSKVPITAVLSAGYALQV